MVCIGNLKSTNLKKKISYFQIAIGNKKYRQMKYNESINHGFSFIEFSYPRDTDYIKFTDEYAGVDRIIPKYANVD